MTSAAEQRYRAQEAAGERRRAATIRRGPVGLIAVCLVVSVGVGVTAAIDLRRLQTPRGAALAWTGALLFGNCPGYDRLTANPAGDSATRCAELLRATAAARSRPSEVAFDVLQVSQTGNRAWLVMRVREPDRPAVEVPLQLERRGQRWLVDVDAATCAVLPCPTPPG